MIERMVKGTLSLSVGGLLGVIAAVFSFKGAVVLPALVAAGVMLAVPYSALYAVVAVVPVNVQFTDSITVARLVIVASLGVIAFQAFARKVPMPSLFLWPYGIAALAFFAAILVSSVAFGTAGLLSRVGSFIIYAAVFFVVLNQADDPDRFRRVLWVLVGVAALQALLVMAEAFYNFTPFGGWQQHLAEERGMENIRVVGTHAHPITLAGFFQVAIAAAVGLALTARSTLVRLTLLIAVGLFFIGWWYTFARSSWIGMLVLIAAAMVAATRTTRTLALIGLFSGVLLLAMYDFSPGAIIRDIESIGTVRSATQTADVAEASESLLWRQENWAAAVNMILSHPLFGVGIDHSPTVARDYLPLGASAHNYIDTAVPHNIFLQLAAEAGLPALAAFLVLWVLAFRALWRAASVETLRAYAVIVFVMLAGQLGTFMFNPMPREIWLTLALAMVLGRMAERVAPVATPARAATAPATPAAAE
ncbi:MAG: O-antigen ligase domain-containing protein [Rhodospirillales bacterium]|nr:MAG: O-antigen ligase domain-containing protein [Rhodospirillales bacterium]